MMPADGHRVHRPLFPRRLLLPLTLLRRNNNNHHPSHTHTTTTSSSSSHSHTHIQTKPLPPFRGPATASRGLPRSFLRSPRLEARLRHPPLAPGPPLPAFPSLLSQPRPLGPLPRDH